MGDIPAAWMESALEVARALEAAGVPPWEWEWDGLLLDFVDGAPSTRPMTPGLAEVLRVHANAARLALMEEPRCQPVRVYVDFSHPVLVSQAGQAVSGLDLAHALALCRVDWPGRDAVLDYARERDRRARRREDAVSAFLSRWYPGDWRGHGATAALELARESARAVWDSRCPEPRATDLDSLPPLDFRFTEAVPRVLRAMFGDDGGVLVSVGAGWARADPVVPDEGPSEALEAARAHDLRMRRLMDEHQREKALDESDDGLERRRAAEAWVARMGAFMDAGPPDPLDRLHPDRGGGG